METLYRVPIGSTNDGMYAVTIKEAKARLNALIDAAVNGEQVVLMRGARHVAAIVPISADDLELKLRLTDEQAGRFWMQLEGERTRGAVGAFESAQAAVDHLEKAGTPARAPGRARGRKP